MMTCLTTRIILWFECVVSCCASKNVQVLLLVGKHVMKSIQRCKQLDCKSISVQTKQLFLSVIILLLILSSCQTSDHGYAIRPPLSFSQVKEMGIEGCLEYYMIPGCSWAVINGQEVTTGASGEIVLGSRQPIDTTHRFQIGSLGKSFTSLMAAKCVEKGLLAWDTTILSVFPTWRESMQTAYEEITLADLLSHRTRLQPLNAHQTSVDRNTGRLVYRDIPNFSGSDTHRRREFSNYALTLSPVETEGMNYGNAGYIIAGCMIEAVTGKSWESLALELASELKIEIGFERPNRLDPAQPWGHRIVYSNRLEPIAPTNLEIYNDPLSSPAGNITISIEDFSTYVRQYMNALHNVDGVVGSDAYKFLLMGRTPYAMGWYNNAEADTIYYHYGSEGTFYCHMMLFSNLNAAIIIFTNADAKENSVNFINDARNYLKYRYLYNLPL